MRDVLSFTVLSHSEVEARLPAGLGTSLAFAVSVADQQSALGGTTGSALFSYARPSVASVTPATASTSGLDPSATASENKALVVRVRGAHFGVAGGVAQLYVALGGSGLPASGGMASVADILQSGVRLRPAVA